MKSKLFFIASFVVLICFGAVARADRMSELQQQFKQRYPEIKKLKSAGQVGETSQGTLEAVNGKNLDSSAQNLVSQENADRHERYDLIAKKENTTAELVAERNGKRNFDRAAPGEYLKDKDGHWAKKS